MAMKEKQEEYDSLCKKMDLHIYNKVRFSPNLKG